MVPSWIHFRYATMGIPKDLFFSFFFFLLPAYSYARSEPGPQLTGMLDPQLTERGQGSNLYPHGY